jgi:hypothetical protein
LTLSIKALSVSASNSGCKVFKMGNLPLCRRLQGIGKVS